MKAAGSVHSPCDRTTKQKVRGCIHHSDKLSELENYLSPFIDAWKGGASEQLQGQIASAKIPLSRLISPQLYWVMSGSDFTLDINNPKEPKVLCGQQSRQNFNLWGSIGTL